MEFSSKKAVLTIFSIFSLFCLFLYRYVSVGLVTNNGEITKNELLITSEQTILVGKIDNYEITRKELEQRLISQFQPNPYQLYTEQTKPVDANSMLLLMMGEKAVAMDERKQGVRMGMPVRAGAVVHPVAVVLAQAQGHRPVGR